MGGCELEQDEQFSSTINASIRISPGDLSRDVQDQHQALISFTSDVSEEVLSPSLV